MFARRTSSRLISRLIATLYPQVPRIPTRSRSPRRRIHRLCGLGLHPRMTVAIGRELHRSGRIFPGAEQQVWYRNRMFEGRIDLLVVRVAAIGHVGEVDAGGGKSVRVQVV